MLQFVAGGSELAIGFPENRDPWHQMFDADLPWGDEGTRRTYNREECWACAEAYPAQLLVNHCFSNLLQKQNGNDVYEPNKTIYSAGPYVLVAVRIYKTRTTKLLLHDFEVVIGRNLRHGTERGFNDNI